MATSSSTTTTPTTAASTAEISWLLAPLLCKDGDHLATVYEAAVEAAQGVLGILGAAELNETDAPRLLGVVVLWQVDIPYRPILFCVVADICVSGRTG